MWMRLCRSAWCVDAFVQECMVCGCVCAGVSASVWRPEFLRPRRCAVLRDALPRSARLAVCDLQQAGDWALRDSHAPQVPPRALCLHVLPATAQQGHVQGTEQQALLPALLSASLQLTAVCPLQPGPVSAHLDPLTACIARWLGSRVVSVLDSGAEGPGFKLQP